MQSDCGIQTLTISDASKWSYLNQGGLHLAFRGMEEYAGYVLKVKKLGHQKQENIDPIVKHYEDEVFVKAISKSPAFSKFMPATVGFV